ncbi:formate dehydrogenase subunit alpha [Streptomyces neyagawaensis]|uniref:formate dehydrogenase subunit alpha n=1 Tax=Streptomyces neyagawaensis TaxID=42238 RepID=UPI0006E3528F|nr:formate dehydrogenase subunit alpha [Streptomyces neyagawaensis]MCL6735148.1 formate dehydrogenase subunit alpha [Streptomyces neyagawaensis]MDE1687543.1 formate dehydrogenase subunit alpha [Streptomyces neyagawaensis]
MNGVSIEVDGTVVEVPEEWSLLMAVRAAGIELPALCSDDRLSPAGSCRTCLVRVGGRVAAACVTPASPAMRVDTSGDEIVRLRREAVEIIVSALPPRALADGSPSELAQVCRSMGIGPELAQGAGGRGGDESHPYVHLDRDLCIACGRCVRMCSELQGTFALTLVGRGGDTVVAPGTGGPWAESDCVACGGCVDTCPTGAITQPGPARGLTSALPPTQARTRTTCGYCGVGCTLDVIAQDGDVTAVLPARDGPVNRGHACVKGRFSHGFRTSPERLTQPLLRRDGVLEPVGWDEALAHIARGLRTAVDIGGPDSVAAISSARATNEENYLVQKFLRVVIGSNNVDNCSRLCHSPSAAGLTASFGLSGGTDTFDDVERADCLLVVGANPVEAHPVVGARLLRRVLHGARLVVADPRAVGLAPHADVHLRPRPGTNVALFHGLAHVLLAEGLIDEAFLRERSTGLSPLTELLADYPPDRVTDLTGVPPRDLVAAARLYGEAERPAIVYGLGVTEHLHGTDGVRSLANLAILRGAVGTDRGYGVNPLRGQNNVQGASDMGALPDLLPGYGKVTDPAARARAENVWGVPVPGRPGLRIPDMFAAARAGDLWALWVIGEDVCATDPDANQVVRALDTCPLVVCNELFLSETARHADVVLPVASWLEKDGTFVNFDRRFQRVRPAVPPPGQARTDFDILRAVADTMGADLGCATPADALAECGRLAPVFAGISHDRLDREGAVPWPCTAPDRPGEAKLYTDRFATADGRAHLAAAPYLPPGERPDDDYPLVLVTGRRWAHYNSGSMTRRGGNLALDPVDFLDIHPDDADRHDVGDGDEVTVESRHGRARLIARVSDQMAAGQVFCSFHFPTSGVNRLTSDVADTVTSCPEYKVTAVRVAVA